LHYVIAQPNKPTIPARQKMSSDKKVVQGDLSQGWTALHRAAAIGARDTVERLLANVDEKALLHAATIDTGKTALHVACSYGHLEIVKLLLATGASAQTCSLLKRKTTLMHALEGRAAESVVLILDRLCNSSKNANALGEARDLDGNTLVHWAAKTDAHSMIWAWILHRSFPHGTNKRGRTPLHIACLRRHPPSVFALLSTDDGLANLTARDNRGRTPLHLLFAGKTEVARFEPEALVISMERVEKCVETMLSFRHDVKDLAFELNEPFAADGSTILHRATLYGASSTCLEMLTEAGAKWSNLDYLPIEDHKDHPIDQPFARQFISSNRFPSSVAAKPYSATAGASIFAVPFSTSATVTVSKDKSDPSSGAAVTMPVSKASVPPVQFEQVMISPQVCNS
jgi:hypothetical protein